jgi:SAM-dependent methyltransferase
MMPPGRQPSPDPAWLATWPEEYWDVLRALAGSLDYSGLQIRQTLSGRGGAQTYLVQPSGDSLPNRIIVKLGSEEVLKGDEAGTKLASTLLGHAHHGIKTVTDHGRTGIAMVLVGDGEGIHFDEFYERSSTADITRLIERLFGRALRRPEHAPRRTDESVFSMTLFDVEVARGLRHCKDEVPGFGAWWRHARDVYRQGSYTLLSHGDLHSGNILVTVDGVPQVIDFGTLRPSHHIMRDPAKFEREIRLLLLRQLPRLDPNALEDALAGVSSASDPRVIKAVEAIHAIRRVAEMLPPIAGDWKFEYKAALLAQFLFAVANQNLLEDVRRTMLAWAIGTRAQLERMMPSLALSDDDVLNERREFLLSRLAYAWFRLDQLPSGGWGRSLAGWMEEIWRGDDDRILRNPEMRTRGGTDYTAYAFHHYHRLLRRYLTAPLARHVLQANGVATAVRQNIAARIGYRGGIGVELVGRAEGPAVRIRHTLMGLLTFLLYGESMEWAIQAVEQVKENVQYLNQHLRDWRKDDSFLFGMYASAVKVIELLEATETTLDLSPDLRRELVMKLIAATSEMEAELNNVPVYHPVPELVPSPRNCAPFFPPYGSFWRMEVAGLLMYLPLLMTEDGTAFHDRVARLKRRCVFCLRELLGIISPRYDATNPLASLIPFHLEGQARRDWGISAQFAAILDLAAVQRALIESGLSPSELSSKRDSLRTALRETFDGYHRHREAFTFATPVAFAHYLHLVSPELFSVEEIEALDHSVDNVLHAGVTEQGLNGLIEHCLGLASLETTPPETTLAPVRDLFLDGLESGEYTPDGRICPESRWRERIRQVCDTTTVTFYDGHGGVAYAKRYADEPDGLHLLKRAFDIGGWATGGGLTAMDLGCGPGQYALQLKDKGFAVTLVDRSKEMLSRAAAAIGVPTPAPIDIYRLDDAFPAPASDQRFDLIWACAILVHVPRFESLRVLRTLHRLLKADGVLFVNFKIGDHSLVSHDGRFFEYYRHERAAERLLEAAGFELEEVNRRKNRRNMYGDPKQISWANLYCRKST